MSSSLTWDTMSIFFISSIQEEILFLDYIKSGSKCVPVPVENYKKVLDKTFRWVTVEEIMSNKTLLEIALQDGKPFYMGAIHSKEAISLKCFLVFHQGGFTPFQLEAMRQGLSPFSFIVFDPTAYAMGNFAIPWTSMVFVPKCRKTNKSKHLFRKVLIKKYWFSTKY